MIGITPRWKLFGILRQGVGDRTRRAREHLLLSGAQSGFGFADELTAGPGQHERQQAHQQQLSTQVHRYWSLNQR